MIQREEKIIKGFTYVRFENSDHWQIDDIHNKNVPNVVCHKCGGTKFELYYGSYCLNARCVKCQTESDVYSG